MDAGKSAMQAKQAIEQRFDEQTRAIEERHRAASQAAAIFL